MCRRGPRVTHGEKPANNLVTVLVRLWQACHPRSLSLSFLSFFLSPVTFSRARCRYTCIDMYHLGNWTTSPAIERNDILVTSRELRCRPSFSTLVLASLSSSLAARWPLTDLRGWTVSPRRHTLLSLANLSRIFGLKANLRDKILIDWHERRVDTDLQNTDESRGWDIYQGNYGYLLSIFPKSRYLQLLRFCFASNCNLLRL
jgi:hypothetical protein